MVNAFFRCPIPTCNEENTNPEDLIPDRRLRTKAAEFAQDHNVGPKPEEVKEIEEKVPVPASPEPENEDETVVSQAPEDPSPKRSRSPSPVSQNVEAKPDPEPEVKENIPSKIMALAKDDPLAAFNEIMKAKDKEKGIDGESHYGLHRTSDFSRSYPSTAITCGHCKKYGHFSEECPSLRDRKDYRHRYHHHHSSRYDHYGRRHDEYRRRRSRSPGRRPRTPRSRSRSRSRSRQERSRHSSKSRLERHEKRYVRSRVLVDSKRCHNHPLSDQGRGHCQLPGLQVPERGEDPHLLPKRVSIHLQRQSARPS